MKAPILKIVTTLLALAALAPTAFAADTDPMVLKNSLRISCWRLGRYFATATAKEPQYNTWCWRPRFEFYVQGPLQGGSQLSVSFFKPDGSPWMNLPCRTPEIPEGQLARITEPSLGANEEERNTTLLTGVFSFKINLKNELTATNKTLYSGKFSVSKFHEGNNLPTFKNQFEYYVDHDWLLPIGYVYSNDKPDEEAPTVLTDMWFRGDVKSTDLGVYVFYQGKQICSSQNSQATISEPRSINTTGSHPDPRWSKFTFYLNTVRLTNKMTSANIFGPECIFMDKNHGDYEIKVLLKGKLARTATITVGEDGKIVDKSGPLAGKLGGMMILPIKVVPGMDGKANPMAYKADAYYMNPLAGFIAP